MRRLIDFYQTQLDHLGVEIKQGMDLNEKTLKEGEIDFVVLSTGATPARISIPDDGSIQTVQAVDVLLDKVQPGENVVVVGASLTGLEVADTIAEGSKKITIIEAVEKPPVRREDPQGYFLYKRLGNANLRLLFNARLAKIEKRSVFYHSNDEEMGELQDINTLILAIGSRSERSLAGYLTDLKISHEIIGDAAKPRTLHDAIHEGFRVSRRLI
jgi:pyruvate/2-oxoglutarate dehydrogenase complex dihydrolipoamide dehydrogenase (E3) component